MRKINNALLALVTTAALAIAHHGLAAFDQTKTITLKGTVTEFHFVNPHCVVEFEVKDDKGQVQSWQGQMTSPAHLKGWTATSLEAGNVVTVSGYRAKSGATYMWITTLNSSNGTELKHFTGD
ncbi:MAG: DUF6152 family protein [Bryobacteraceae bacterium]